MTSFFIHLSIIHLIALHLHAFNAILLFSLEFLVLSGNTGLCSQSLFCTATFYFSADAVNIAHNTTTTLTYPGRLTYPVWYMNGSLVLPSPLYVFKYDPSTGGLLAILTIDGNETCDNVTVSCRLEGQTVYTVRLNIEGL